jgi:gas vesicle structural protein
MAAVATQGTAGNYLQRGPSPSGLADVLNVILDKGLVIDVYLRVSLVGIELLTVDARIVIASVDTYLRFAEAVNRLDLTEVGEGKTLPEFFEGANEGAAKSRTKGVLEGAKEKIFGDDDDDSDDEKKKESGSGSRSRSSSSGSRSRSSSSGSRSRSKRS